MERVSQPVTRFHEQQYFRQVWLWTMLVAFAGFILFALIMHLYDRPFYGIEMSPRQAFVALAGLGVVVAIYLFIHLETWVKDDGIYYRFFPFHFETKKIEWNELTKIYIRKYNPVLEYGGWGIRLGLFGKGRSYSVSGTRGLQLVFTNGKKLLLGTRNHEDLKNALRQLGRLTQEYSRV